MGIEAVCSVIRVDGKWVQASTAVKEEFTISLSTSTGENYDSDVYYDDTPPQEND